MKKLVLALLVLSIVPVVSAQNISADFHGECKDYLVTIRAEGFESGCYDVKVDVFDYGLRVGKVFDPKKGWKSSTYYVDEALCIPEENETTLKLEVDSKKNLTAEIKLRRGSKVWEKELALTQSCPEPEPMDAGRFLGIITVIVLVLAAGIYLYLRK